MKKNKLMWFANDADGLSMVDALTVIIVIMFIAFKIAHIAIIVNVSNTDILTYLGTSIEIIDNMMIMVITSYFVKKGIDSTVSKICLTKEHKYKELCDNMREDLSSSDTKKQDDISVG